MTSFIAPVIKAAWPIFWITSAYSYISCGVIGVIAGIRTKGNHAEIDKRIDAFIISPFYVATFFSLFSVLYFWRGTALMREAADGSRFWSMLGLGIVVFIGHTLLELLEATVIRRDPLRMLSDHDALRLSGIYLLNIVLTAGAGLATV